MDSELLKHAIADAKAVRATALANAKAALEEAFAPALTSMLSNKLQQEIADEEVTDEAPAAPVLDEPVADEVPVADAPVDVGAPVADEPAPEGDFGLDAAPVADDFGAEAPIDAPVGEPDGDEAPIEEYSPLGNGNPNPADQTEELTEADDTDYKKTTTGHKTQDPQGPKKEWSKGPGKADKSNTAGSLTVKTGGKTTIKRDVASISDDPQGASNEFSKGPGKADKNETGKVLEEDDTEIDNESLDSILKELESEVNQVSNDAAAEPTFGQEAAPAPAVGAGEDEEINLDELLSESDDDDEDDKEDKDEDEEEKDEKKLPPWLQKENKILKAENAEYRKAVGFLRDRINEVNLLNAKLLYTNRLFKASSLNKEQKIKVIESFDLTKSVREAKLVYATLAESLSFGATKKVVVATAPAKKPASTTVKAITEGLASKVVASTKPTKTTAVLSEGTIMANRFKKLAGIKQ